MTAPTTATASRDPPRAHELPGLWFSDKEIHALLTMHQLIQGLEAEGVLGRHLQPLLDKLHGMLGADEAAARELMQRVNIVAAVRRPVDARHFELIGSALLERSRIDLLYFSSRARRRKPARGFTAAPDPLSQHLVPGRLVPSQRRLAPLRAGRGARRGGAGASRQDVPLAKVRAELDGGYGVFAGKRLKCATLALQRRCRAMGGHRTMAPATAVALAGDGSLELHLPYADSTELSMDILRHGDQVRVLAPKELAAQVAMRLRRSRAAYRLSNAADPAGAG